MNDVERSYSEHMSRWHYNLFYPRVVEYPIIQTPFEALMKQKEQADLQKVVGGLK